MARRACVPEPIRMLRFSQANVCRLIDLLLDERQSIDDPNFVQDFLLTYRTFIDNPVIITDRLLEVFEQNYRTDASVCERVERVLLSWVNNHYNDFESNPKLGEFLEKFDDHLQHDETEVTSVAVRH